jgi:hypothetical protein
MAGGEAMRRGHHVDEFGFDFTYPMLASARRHRDVVGGIHQGLIDPISTNRSNSCHSRRRVPV